MNTEIAPELDHRYQQDTYRWLFLVHGIALVFLGLGTIKSPIVPSGKSPFFGIFLVATGVINITYTYLNKLNKSRILTATIGGISTVAGMIYLASTVIGIDISPAIFSLALAISLILNGALFMALVRKTTDEQEDGLAWANYLNGLFYLGYGLMMSSVLFIPAETWNIISPIWALTSGLGLIILAIEKK